MRSQKFIVSIILILPSLLGLVLCGYETITTDELILNVFDTQLPWSDAVAVCRSMNQTLLAVESEHKDRVLVDLFINGGTNVKLPGNNTWISATESREGVWIWEPTGEPLYYTRWFIGQPDDLTSLNCVYQSTQALLYWRDADCTAPMYFICESKP